PLHVLSASVREATQEEEAARIAKVALIDVRDLLWPIRGTARARLGEIYERLAFLNPTPAPDGLVHMRCTECGYQDRQRPEDICGKCGKACVPTFYPPDGAR